MTYAARSAWTLVAFLAVAAGVATYLWIRPGSEVQRAPAGSPGGQFFAIHAAPQLLADLAFENEKGHKLTLTNFRDKAVLLNIWATWCVPCREEMPALDRLQQKLGGQNFEVVALSIDSAGVPAVKRFYEETGVRSLAIYVDPSMRATSSLHVVGVPTTVLIDRKGREIGRHTGPAQWDGEGALQAIKTRLESQ